MIAFSIVYLTLLQNKSTKKVIRLFSELTEPVTQLHPVLSTNSNDVGFTGRLHSTQNFNTELYILVRDKIL